MSGDGSITAREHKMAEHRADAKRDWLFTQRDEALALAGIGDCGYCGHRSELVDERWCSTCAGRLAFGDLAICEVCGMATEGYETCQMHGAVCRDCRGACTHPDCWADQREFDVAADR